MKLKIVALALITLPVAAILVFRSNEQKSGEEAALTPTDPRVEAMVEPQPKCPGSEDTYIWICGSVLKMPGLNPANICTSEDEPLFTGSLSLPGQSSFYKSTLLMSYALPLEPLVPCVESWPESTHSCAQVVLFPKVANMFGIFDEVPPNPLPRAFPSPPFDSTGHTLKPNYFAEFDGAPVALNYTKWIGDKPGAAPDICRLETRISSLNIGLELSLPCAKMDRWQDELGNLVNAIKTGILASDLSANCEIPPVGTTLLLNKHSAVELKKMSEWLDLYR